MYAIIKVGASQFKVCEGDTIFANRIKDEEGQNITLSDVLMVGQDSDVKIGTPFVNGAKVEMKVVKHLSGEKKIAFKFRRRKKYAKKKGHRQRLTELSIVKIAG